jgi:5,10-methylenetetrahydrofolate reductase
MTTDCPKRMTYGPCGGVEPDGGCEVPDHPGRRCVFVDGPVVHWPARPAVSQPAISPLATALGVSTDRPVVIADLPARALDVDSLRRSASRLAGQVDAVLLGDHGGERVQLPPALRAGLVQAEGTPAWAGLNCRDRNRVALEGELAGLAAVGVPGVHCVTGDHPSVGHRPDAAAVFDLDSTELAALAATAGLLTSVAENPVAPPVALRAERVAQKAAAGARVCFVNHTSGATAVRSFVSAAQTACTGLGVDLEFVACVAVVTDQASAALLRSFTGLELPPGYLETILRADDVRATGIRMAVDLAQSLLAVPGVRGVNLSGVPRPGAELAAAGVLAEISTQVRGLRP